MWLRSYEEGKGQKRDGGLKHPNKSQEDRQCQKTIGQGSKQVLDLQNTEARKKRLKTQHNLTIW